MRDSNRATSDRMRALGVAWLSAVLLLPGCSRGAPASPGYAFEFDPVDVNPERAVALVRQRLEALGFENSEVSINVRNRTTPGEVICYFRDEPNPHDGRSSSRRLLGAETFSSSSSPTRLCSNPRESISIGSELA